MMDALEALKDNQILYYQNVIDIKECIRLNYPHYTQKRTAELFAAAIHKIIDKNIAYFEKDVQASIKETLLQTVTRKDVFAINAYDVLEACTTLQVADEKYLDNLTEWINQNQTIPFSKNEVVDFLNRLKSSEDTLTNPIPTVYEEQLTFLPIEENIPSFLDKLKSFQKPIVVAAALLSLIFAFQVFDNAGLKQKNTVGRQTASMYTADKGIFTHLVMIRPKRDNFLQKAESLHVHPSLQYKEINKEALGRWLGKKQSMLADEPYFSSIIGAAEEYNINPLLLFAITGQEQSFVPKSNPKAVAIANNPFNVYGSWQAFNTDITNTSRIAARTIITLSEGCPQNENPVKWINKKYAEDPNWHLGVSDILAELEKTAGN